nr:ISAzo13 family transposase [Leptolyngbya sp. Cla-17]
MIELKDALKALYIKTAQKLKGTDRRQFMAEVVKGLGIGGQSQAEQQLGWNRGTIRKGMRELTTGQAMVDGYSRSGRKRVETRLPHLLEDIQAIVDAQSQIDPSFKSSRLYTRLSAAQVRQQLILQKGYPDEALPSEETIRQRLNELGYHLRRVAQIKPKKRIAQTEAIFEHLHQVNQQADAEPHVLRLSMDAKVALKVGEFDRGGKTRVPTVALDHDFGEVQSLTPYGIFLPEHNELSLFFVYSTLTADCIVDLLEQWWQREKERFSYIQTLVLNQDNGPENHSRRTQFMRRIIEFADKHKLTVQLAYYPPYHSKYNPVERSFGWLEQHWNGSLLDCVETVVRFAETLSFKGNHSAVSLVKQVYETGVKLSKQAMAETEQQIQRLPSLPKWFVEIRGKSP